MMADMSALELEIVSDSYANIDRCWLLLNAEIDKAYLTRPVSIDVDLAKSLSDSQVCCLPFISSCYAFAKAVYKKPFGVLRYP